MCPSYVPVQGLRRVQVDRDSTKLVPHNGVTTDGAGQEKVVYVHGEERPQIREPER